MHSIIGRLLVVCAVAAGVLLGQSTTVNNVVPNSTVQRLTASDPPQNITVNGVLFNACSVVRFAGTNLTTNVVSTSQLTASIPASMLLTPGVRQISVFRYNQVVGTASLICSTTAGTLANGTPDFTVTPAFLITSTSPLPSAVQNQQYGGFTFQAQGGIQTLTWSIAPGSSLPTGMTLSTNGVLGGTPTVSGTFNFNVRATDVQGQQTTKSFQLTVAPGLQITTSTLANGNLCSTYSQQMNATGGAQPYTWSGSSLPTGLTINPSTGVISGIPTQGGQLRVLIRVQDANGIQDSVAYNLSIGVSNLAISTATLPSGNVGVAYNGSVQATGGSGAGTFSATGLPPGITLSSSGVLSGTPTQAATFNVNFTVSQGSSCTASRIIAITISGAELTITTPALNNGSVGTLYTQQLQASGGTGLSWSLFDGALPTGLALSQAGVLSGTPSQAGNFTVVIQVSDSLERTARRQFTFQIASNLTITTATLPNGAVGSLYTQQLQASGGTGTLTWALPSGSLPPGVSLNGATGVISGTPTQGGSFSFTIQVSDSAQRIATRTFSVTITSQLVITTASIPQARLGQPYEVLFQASGASGTLVWTLLGGVPPGLTLNASTGLLSGTPTLGGDFPLNVQVRDSSNATASRNFTLSVQAALTIITESPLPNAQAGVAYQLTFSANGGTTPFRWLATTALPSGLTLDPFGVLSGTPAQAGTVQFTVQVTDNSGGVANKAFQLTITSPFRISTEALPNGSVGVFFNQTLSTQGGRAPVRWGLDSGQLPLGLILNSNTGGLTGTPQQAGDFTFTIFATDADNQRVTRQFTMTIRGQFRITTETLPDGAVGTAYSQTLATTGGTSPFTWTLADGVLPGGVTLNRTSGAMSGTPSAAGTFDFTVQVIDAGNQSARQRYTLNIIGPPRVVTDSLPAGRVGTAYSITLEAAGGAPPYTWTATGVPAGLRLDGETGILSGTPTAAANANVNLTVRDSANRQASRQLALTIAAGLSVVTSTLPAGTVGTAYAQTLQASGGTGLSWRVSAGTLPQGLTLSVAGAVSGTPAVAGTASFTVEVRDSTAATATRQLSITVANLVLSPLTVRLSVTNPQPGDQPNVVVELADPAPSTLQGTLSLTFAAVGGGSNPEVQFSQGSNPRFTIAQGQRQATFTGGGLALQLGTVAGTATITARLTAGAVDVTPSPVPTQTITIARAAPVISSFVLRKDGSTLTVEMTGFVTSKEVTSAEFQFAIRQGASVQTSNFTVALGTTFSAWFQSTASAPFGGQFRLTMPFNVSGSINDITGVTVTLVNAVGRSATRTGNF